MFRQSASKRLTGLLFIGLLSVSAFADPETPSGKWLAEDIDGRGVIDRLQTTLDIHADGIVTGTGGCNRYAGSANTDGGTIRFLPMASTRMACSTSAMNQEARFHAALEKVTSWRIDPSQQKLLLLDKWGSELMRFSKMD